MNSPPPPPFDPRNPKYLAKGQRKKLREEIEQARERRERAGWPQMIINDYNM